MDGLVKQHDWIDQRVFDLYDEYCHGRIDRRAFLKQAALVAGGLAMAQALMPRYAKAQTISFTDERIKAQLRHLPLARRQLGHDARLSRAAQGQRAVSGRAGGPRESRAQSLHRGRGAPLPRSRASWRWRRTDCSRSAAIPATTMTAATLQAKLDQASCAPTC